LYQNGMMPGGAGNISIRDRDGIYITPSGVSKGFLNEEDIVVVDSHGKCLFGDNPTSELPMHLAIYQKRDDIDAIIHCHAANTVALSVHGRNFISDLLPEIKIKYGSIPVLDYAEPSTQQSADVLIPHLDSGICGAILPFHGIVTMADTLENACLIAESIEYAAQVQVLAQTMGNIRKYTEARN